MAIMDLSLEPRIKDFEELKRFINDSYEIIGKVSPQDIIDWVDRKINLLKHIERRQYKEFIKGKQ